MKTQILFIAALIALSSAVNLRRQENELQKHLVTISQAEKDRLFEHFPLLAQMTGPLDGVYDFIDDMEDALRNEQRQADQLFATESARCEAELGKRTNNVEMARKALKTERNRNEACQEMLDNGQLALTNTMNAGNALAEAQEAATNNRNRQAAVFSKKQTDYNAFIAGVDQAIAFVNEMAAVPENTVLVQLHSNVKTQALSLVKSATSVNMLSETAPAIKNIAMLIKMTQDQEVGEFGQVGVNDPAIVEVLELLNGLKTTTIGKLRMLEAQEAEDLQNHQAAMAQMEEDMNSNEAEIERLTAVVAENEACVDETAGFIFELGGQNGRIAKQEHILEKATTMCESFAAEHERTTELRTQQKGLLAALREALTMKLDQIYGTARTRANQEEEEWDNLGIRGF